MIFLVGALFSAPAHAAGDAGAGRAVYAANCTACHGTAGNGKGPAAIALTPKPTDFTDRTWQSTRTDEALIAAIKGGRPNTAMTSFTTLSDADLANLIVYLRSLAPPAG